MAVEAVGDRPGCILLLLENCWKTGACLPLILCREGERSVKLLTKAKMFALPHPPYWIAVPSETPLVLINVHVLSLDVSVS